MKVLKLFLILVISLLSQSNVAVAMTAERNINIDPNWKFHLGDNPNAKNIAFDDSNWRSLNLPHDWSIEGEYDKNAPSGWEGAFLPTGIGWYRKEIEIPPDWQEKKVFLRFDGVYLNSDVWVNGKHIGHRPNGYVSFEYDITKSLRKKRKLVKTATITVRVDHSLAPTGRWYTGSGIYRHVWLDVVEKSHLVTDGLFVKTESVVFKTNDAILSVSTEVNTTQGDKSHVLVQKLLDEGNNEVAKNTKSFVPDGKGITSTSQRFLVKGANLWSPDSPNLYRLETSLIIDGEVQDTISTNVGIRTIDYDVERGFVLNNKPLLLKGMSFHHDGGPVGSAVPDELWRIRLKQLKEMGLNALRPAHTPFAPIFYDLADEMGFIVMNEAFDGWEQEKAAFDYGLYFERWWKEDLSAVIRRDRNHPSVAIWSIGNEVGGATAKTQKMLVDFVKRLDPTRPVTQGRGYMLGHLDIDGFNGHGEFKGYLEDHHKKHPDKALIGTEITHTLQTRGVYRTQTSYRTKDNPAPWEIDDPIGRWNKIKDRVHMVPDLSEQEVFPNENPKYDSSYDNSFVRMNIRDEIKMAKNLPYLLGTFRWTAFDYLGESFGWPARTANFGIIDLAGFEKDGYYLYQSQWSKKPMVHMLPHWTHPGKEGIEIPVVVYSNLDEAELFLNGKSLGSQTMGDDLQFVWQVPYEAGELTVVAHNGESILTQTYTTAKKAHSVKLTPNKNSVIADHKDLVLVTVDVVDASGNFVPHANNNLSFKLSGPGKIIGIDNGDILDLSHHVSPTRRAFKGKARVFIQSCDSAGNIILEVTGDGLKQQRLNIVSKHVSN